MVAFAVDIPAAEVARFCRRRHIRRLSVFGSATRPDFRADSDIDILVEFAAGHTPGLEFIGMQDELSAILGGRRVDLVTEKFLNRRIRPSILESAAVIYEE